MEEEEIIEFAMHAGQLMLENGAEIFRVEETIDHICHAYGVHSQENYVLSNGIFITSGDKKEEGFAKVKHIPVRGAHLDTVTAINELSREIEENHYSLEIAKDKLLEIENMNHYSNIVYIFASGAGSAGFCYLFGGNIYDSLFAFIAGFILYIYILFIGNHFSKIVMNVFGGVLVTLICVTEFKIVSCSHLNYMIIGSIMPLIPGVPFINSIREIAQGDYLSGTIRMLDALVVFFSIAVGVGLTIHVLNYLIGGFGL